MDNNNYFIQASLTEKSGEANSSYFANITLENLMELRQISVDFQKSGEFLLDIPKELEEDMFSFCDHRFAVLCRNSVAVALEQEIPWDVASAPQEQEQISLSLENIGVNLLPKKKNETHNTLFARAEVVIDEKIIFHTLEIHNLRGNLFLIYPTVKMGNQEVPFVKFLDTNLAEKIETLVLNTYSSHDTFLRKLEQYPKDVQAVLSQNRNRFSIMNQKEGVSA